MSHFWDPERGGTILHSGNGLSEKLSKHALERALRSLGVQSDDPSGLSRLVTVIIDAGEDSLNKKASTEISRVMQAKRCPN